MKRAVITGAAGFIGSNLATHLLAKEIPVIALVHRKDSEALPFEIQQVCNILDEACLKTILQQDDVVFHTAAKISFNEADFAELYRANVDGTRTVLDSAWSSGVRKVVHLSACAVLGTSPGSKSILDETANPPIAKSNAYAYTKALAEEECRNFAARGLDISIANISTVYGGGDRKLNSGSIIKKIAQGGMRLIPPGGTSYVGMSDLTAGLLLLAENGKSGERYILNSENLAYVELIRRIANIFDIAKKRFLIPSLLRIPLRQLVAIKNRISGSKDEKMNLVTPQIIHDIFAFKYFSAEKAKSQLGWNPQQSLESAVKEAVLFYKSANLW